MSTDLTMKTLREAAPRYRHGFDEWVERLDALRIATGAAPVAARRAKRRLPHRGIVAASVAVVAAAAVYETVGLSPTTTSVQSALAAARRALSRTTHAHSGTMTTTESSPRGTMTLETTAWNHGNVSLTGGARHLLGSNRKLLLVGPGAFLQKADGTWVHYRRVGDIGPKLGPMVQLARANVAGNTAAQILALARNLHRTAGPDGTTIYTGTIPNNGADAATSPKQDTLLRVIGSLRAGNQHGAPGGYHNSTHLRMTVARGGFVRDVSLAVAQHDSNSAKANGVVIWRVTYSRLDSTPPINPASAK